LATYVEVEPKANIPLATFVGCASGVQLTQGADVPEHFG